jgi:hypothetical protein
MTLRAGDPLASVQVAATPLLGAGRMQLSLEAQSLPGALRPRTGADAQLDWTYAVPVASSCYGQHRRLPTMIARRLQGRAEISP